MAFYRLISGIKKGQLYSNGSGVRMSGFQMVIVF
jgi:hypothetical protein